MPLSQSENADEAGPNGRIERDLACARCGYNLRTLAHADRCPECGLPVQESLAPNTFDTAPPAWVRLQFVGVWLQLASYLVGGVAVFAEMHGAYIPAQADGAMIALRAVPLVGIVVAAWLLTSPRPMRQASRSAFIVRYGFAALLAIALVLPGVEHSGFRTPLGRIGWAVFFALFIICFIGLGGVQVRIARAIGIPRAAGLIWTGSILWAIALASAALFYVFREFTQRSLFNRAEPAFVYTFVIGGMMIVVNALLLAIAFTVRRRQTA